MYIFLKKTFSFFLILLIAFRLSFPAVILADDTTPTPTQNPTTSSSPTDTSAPTVDPSTVTPTPTTVDQTEVNNTAADTNTTNSTANTGSNTTTDTGTLTPTQDPSLTPTVTPDPSNTPTDSPAPSLTPDPSATPDPNSSSVDASNSAAVSNTSSSTANTGANTTSSDNTTSNVSVTPSITPTPTPQITVQTGDGVSVVAGNNTINTTSINANATDQTINIFGDSNGDIDLSTLFQLVHNIITQDNNTNPVINVQITGVNNYAYLSNTVVSTANTGNNTTTGSGNVVVSTGNAESVVSLINKVNLTVVNSSLHVVTINIFGQLTGNIILPNIAPLQSTSCTSCGVSFNTNNQATVTNTVDSTANTGSNTTAATGSAEVTTGNADSQTNVVNIVNQTDVGVLLEYLFITDFGNWTGNFIGWDGFGQQTGGTNLSLASGQALGDGTTPTGNIQSTTVNNTAVVNNSISSLANTGGNTTNGQNVSLTTGSAYSAVSLINFINSNFFHTLGFFGFINIFGNWQGDIGGAKEFAALSPTPTPQQIANGSPTSTQQESGGLLSVTDSNNVASFVFPGDTVTFFLTTKNVGTGKVYGAKLNLSLVHNGQNVGGTAFNLGDIPVSRGIKITTGLVLSKDAKPGEYIAKAVVTGTTGPDDTNVSAESDSAFTIFGNGQLATTIVSPTPIPLHHAVLAASNRPTPQSDALLLFLLAASVSGYVMLKGMRNRKILQEIWQTSAPFKQKLLTLRLLLV